MSERYFNRKPERVQAWHYGLEVPPEWTEMWFVSGAFSFTTKNKKLRIQIGLVDTMVEPGQWVVYSEEKGIAVYSGGEFEDQFEEEGKMKKEVVKKYRRLRMDVEAVRLSASNLEEVSKWCNGKLKGTSLPRESRCVELNPGGDFSEDVEIGDYIVKDPNGFFFMVSEIDFKDHYQERE